MNDIFTCSKAKSSMVLGSLILFLNTVNVDKYDSGVPTDILLASRGRVGEKPRNFSDPLESAGQLIWVIAIGKILIMYSP